MHSHVRYTASRSTNSRPRIRKRPNVISPDQASGLAAEPNRKPMPRAPLGRCRATMTAG
jgi:hypothetical protein